MVGGWDALVNFLLYPKFKHQQLKLQSFDRLILNTIVARHAAQLKGGVGVGPRYLGESCDCLRR
jgi:hypothetical protein